MPNVDQAREWMQGERDRLDGLAARSRESARPSDDPAPDTLGSMGTHPGDAGTDRETQMEDAGLADETGRQRDELDAALQRIDDGTWGTCTVCGTDIDEERLEALPQTATCRDHR